MQENSSDTGQDCIHGGGGDVIKPLNLDEMTHPTRASLFRASLSAVSCDGTDDEGRDMILASFECVQERAAVPVDFSREGDPMSLCKKKSGVGETGYFHQQLHFVRHHPHPTPTPPKKKHVHCPFILDRKRRPAS